MVIAVANRKSNIAEPRAALRMLMPSNIVMPNVISQIVANTATAKIIACGRKELT